MDKKQLVKAGAGLVVSTGVGAIVGNIVAMSTPAIGVGFLMKGVIGAGSYVLSSMVSDKAVDYTEQKIDEVSDAIDEIRGKFITVEIKEEVKEE